MAWFCLHKILDNFGKKHYVRVNILFMGYVLYYTVLGIFCFLGLYEVISFTYWIPIFDIVIIMLMVFVILFYGAIINEHDLIHDKILLQNEEILLELLKNQSAYFECSEFVPSEEIFITGVREIKKFADCELEKERKIKKKQADKNEEDIVEKRRKIIKKVITSSIQYISFIRKILQHNYRYDPFKIMGVRATMATVTNILLGLLSIVSSLLGAFIAKNIIAKKA